MSEPHGAPGQSSRRRRLLHRYTGWYGLPAFVVFSVTVIFPILYNLFYSFTNWDGFASSYRFVGLSNFRHMLHDPLVQAAVRNTLLYAAISAPLGIGISLVLALCVTGPGRLRAIARVVIVMPIAISGAAVGILGNLIFGPENSFSSLLTHTAGFTWLPADWLGNPHLALLSTILMSLWQGAGFGMLIFVAGLLGIPTELYEAASIDGASSWNRFRQITWPMLAPAATVAIVLSVIGSLKVFDVMYVLTSGGPDNATLTVVMLANKDVGSNLFAYSAAINLSLTLAILVISVILLGLLRRREARI